MLQALDHIIIGVNDLAQATHIFNEKLGLAVSGGGIHPSGGTANRIIVIGDTYLELITIRAPDEAQESMLKRLALGEGYLNCVFASDDILAESQALVRRGISIIGPNAGELKSAAGHTRGWIRTDIERPDLTQRYPFIIQHDSSSDERRFRLAGWTTPPQHPLGAIRVISTTLAVTNLNEATQRFQHIYGLQPSMQFSGSAEGWDATLVSFPLAIQGQTFELAMPAIQHNETNKNDISPIATESLTTHLQQFGESLYRMTLAVESLASARHYLDQHGVAYSYIDASSHKTQATLWIHPAQTSNACIVLREL